MQQSVDELHTRYKIKFEVIRGEKTKLCCLKLKELSETFKQPVLLPVYPRDRVVREPAIAWFEVLKSVDFLTHIRDRLSLLARDRLASGCNENFPIFDSQNRF